MEVGDKVKFIKKIGEYKTDVQLGSVGILKIVDNDEDLNHFVTFNSLGTSEWFMKDELELVK